MKVADLYKAKALGLEKGSGGGGGDYLELSGGTMSGDINMDGNAVTGIGTPTNAGDAAPKGYVDDKIDESKEAFVAVYGSTTYEDVVAAIDANKVIMLDMPANHNLFNMTYVTYTNGGNAIMYAIFKMNDRPTLMTATLTPANQWTIAHTDLQDRLVSGTNIKTINNQSLLGSGNIEIEGGGIFIAKQHQTTAQEIIEAYNAGKVICVQPLSSDRVWYLATNVVIFDQNTLWLICHIGNENFDSMLFLFRVGSSGWSDSYQYLQKQLVSGENIKTINNQSIIGSGNLDVGGGDVFKFTYGQTPYADVLAAYNDKKVFVGILDTERYFMSAVYKSGNAIVMMYALYTGSNKTEFSSFVVHSDDTWGNSVTNAASTNYVDTADTALQTQLGDLTALTTDVKTNLVGAINEVNGKVGQHLEVGVEKWYGTYRESGVTYQVYSKIIKIDALPSTAGITNYPHGITGIKQILSVYGFCTNGMVMNAPRQTLQDNICIYQVQKSGNIAIEVGKDRSSIGGYVVLIYAKNN